MSAVGGLRPVDGCIPVQEQGWHRMCVQWRTNDPSIQLLVLGIDVRRADGSKMAMIELRNITKSYAHGFNRTFVLRNVSMRVEEGEFISIMGPSGSGKSTLLHILGMLDEPSAGEYFFLEEPVHKISERKRTELHRRFIGFVFQAYHLIDDLTVFENLETPLLYKGVRGSERKGLVAEMLDRFHIVAKKDLFPSQLSGGQQQLVAIARALIIHPRLILADEPTGNLQSAQGAEIMETFRQLNEEDGVTIIQVTHSEALAAYGSRTLHLLDGRIERDESGEAAVQDAPIQQDVAP